MIEWTSPKEEERKTGLLNDPVESSLNTINEINQMLEDGNHEGPYNAKIKNTLHLVETFLRTVK